MKNNKVKIPVGLSRDVGIMIEHFDDKLDLVAEHISHIAKKVDRIEKVVDYHTEAIEVIKTDIEFIKDGLKKKVDIDEFFALERRVALLESRR